MQKLLVLLMVGFLSSVATFSQSPVVRDWTISDSGWGEVRIGQPLAEIGAILGSPREIGKEPHSKIIFVDYEWKDTLFCFLADTERLGAIFFWNHSASKQTAIPDLKTDRDINWNSTEEDVLKAYGTPKDLKITSIRKGLRYDRMGFLFQDGKLIGICVHDDKENWIQH